jgi:hypothetical protein
LKSIPPRKEILGFNPFSIYEKTPGFNLGEGELVVGGSSTQVVGRMAAYLMMTARTPDGNFPFQGVTVIAPSRLVWNYSDADILEMIVEGGNALRTDSVTPDERKIIQKLLTIHRSDRLEVSHVLKAISDSGKKQLLLVPEANKYRDPNVVVSVVLGRTAVSAPEDQWIPHIASLASQCITLAKANNSLLVLDAPENPPERDSNQKLLREIDDLYTYYIKYTDERTPEESILNSATRWLALAASGRAVEAFAELDAANIDPGYKAQLVVQIASRTGNNELAIRTIKEELSKGTNFPAEMAARFGRIAQRSGDEETAKKLLDQSIESISDEALLQAILMSCTAMKDAALVERTWTRLKAVFPDSELLLDDCEVRLMQLCQLVPGDEQEVQASRIGFSEVHHYVCDALSLRRDVDYKALLKTVSEKWKAEGEFVALCGALHAQCSHDPLKALTLGVLATDSDKYEARSVQILLAAMRRMMLMELIPLDGLEVYKLPLVHVISYLAVHPDDAQARNILSSVLSVESAGLVGLPILASFTLDMATKGAELAPQQVMPPMVPEEDLKAFFEKSLTWMAQQTVVELGVTRLPPEFAGDNAAGLIRNLTALVRNGAMRREGIEDLDFLQKCVFLICLLTPYAPQGYPDLDALRLLAAKCWIEGQSQRARDLAEQILEVGSDTRERQRIAWGCYADIYQRTQSPIDALIGISCAVICGTKIEPSDLFQEAYTLLRIARDIHLYDIAQSILPACRNLYDMQNLGSAGRLRLDGIELGLQLAQVPRKNLKALDSLVKDTHEHCEQVMESEDELFTAASHFTQATGLYERAGGQLNETTRGMLDRIYKKLGPETASFLRAISTSTPSAEDVIHLHNRLEVARNSEDIANDQISVVLAAHRLLLPRLGELAPHEAAIGIELLAEHAIELPGNVTPLLLEWPSEYIKKLSSEGLAVLMLGLDEQGEVVALLAENGELEVKRPDKKASSFLKRLDTWNVEYPYRYGLIEREDGNGEFYATMKEFEIPMPLASRVLVIAEPFLLQLPFNLIQVNGDLAGESKAIGIAPSLTWFEAARRLPSTNDGRRMAWISAGGSTEVFGTLEMIFARLRPIFDTHGFTTDTSGRIPTDLRGAQMVVVTAHGQLTSEDRYIHRIADEQTLAESPVALARALAGVELVILFVCSGGRIDRHPLANTTVSLPKMLLDRGCRTVIASPWPLAAAVTGNWLEGFLAAWDGGATALDANFRANQRVNDALGPEPQYTLAMTVQGDVLLRKTELAQP